MKTLLCALIICLLPTIASCDSAATQPPAAPAPPVAPFPVTAHDKVTIEWWYLNAHVTTTSGRHLAVVASFFRFGNGVSLLDGITPQPRAHYILYGVTDLDTGAHRAYSYCDKPMMASLRQLAPLMIAADPEDKKPLELLEDLDKGKLPPPHKLLDGPASVTNTPFALRYGNEDSLMPAAATNAYTLTLGDPGADSLNLTFTATKPPMAVGGKGETGLRTPTDMYYYSLTRCAVTGTIDAGQGPEPLASGQGWFDHQWGTSWVADNDGWDWWGVQLDNGEDLLLYRQRDLANGRIFSPSATFMDAQGVQTAASNVTFSPDPDWIWRNPADGTLFPLGWTVRFPGRDLTLHIYAAVEHQAIPTLGPGGGIWEGSCRVAGTEKGAPVTGVAFMELVGYDNSKTKAWAERVEREGQSGR